MDVDQFDKISVIDELNLYKLIDLWIVDFIKEKLSNKYNLLNSVVLSQELIENGLLKKSLLSYIYNNDKNEFKKHINNFWPVNIKKILKIENIISKIYIYSSVLYIGKYINFIVIYGDRERLFMKNHSLGVFKINFSDLVFCDDGIIFNDKIHKTFDNINIKYGLNSINWVEKMKIAKITCL